MSHQPISGERLYEELLEIYSHLASIIVQAAPKDDRIIIDHVRDAHLLTKKLLHWAQMDADEERHARLRAVVAQPQHPPLADIPEARP